MMTLPRLKKYAALYGTVFGFLAFTPSFAFAQLPANLQDSAVGEADAGRVEQRLQESSTVPSVSPRVDVQDLVLQNAPAGAEKLCFVLNSLEVEGVSAYDQSTLNSVYGGKIGQEICLDELYGIANRLTNKYRNDGYILTQVIVPPQTIDGGNARLRVVEGYVDRVIVDGDLDESEMVLIRAYAANIQTGQALNSKNLERELLLINDIPGISARSVLGPSPTTPGAADMRIIVERDRYDAYVGVDNHGSRYLGPLQLAAAGSVNSLFGANERISAQVVVAPDINKNGNTIELAFVSLGYSQPINNMGTVANASFSHSSTEPGYNLEQFDVKGKSQSFNVGLTHPFIRSRNENLYGRVNFNWRDVHSSNVLEPTREDRIRAIRVGGTYEFLDTLWRVGINTIDLEVSHGLDIFGSSDPGDLFLTRPLGDPNFVKFNFDLQRLQSLTDSVNLLVGAKGQASNDALLSSEEFGVGGMDIGRAYDPSEIIGDEGVAGKLELQWNRPASWQYMNNYQLFGFFDAGRIWNDDATTSSTKTDTITSAGLGVRANLVNDINAGMALAFPLNRDIETQGDDDPRFYFHLNRRF